MRINRGVHVKSLCQPDDTKACTACCGLFNHLDISENNLLSFLNDGHFRVENAWRYMYTGSYLEQTSAVRDFSTHICHIQGILNKHKPGCLKHPLYCGKEERDDSLYGSKVCDTYSCPAYSIFDSTHKDTIVVNIDGWYLYTIAIIDPLSTIWILDELGEETSPTLYSAKLQQALKIHARHLLKYPGIIFCYSMDEYEMNYKNYSLGSNHDHLAVEKKEILEMFNTF